VIDAKANACYDDRGGYQSVRAAPLGSPSFGWRLRGALTVFGLKPPCQAASMTPDQDAFLRDHLWALLATSRTTGGPQVTMVAYHYDGTDAVVSCVRRAAKFANARAHPDVVLTVPDGRRYLSVYGAAECLATGPERDDLTRRVRDALEPPDAGILEDAFARGLDVAGRVIIRVRPTNVLGRI